MRPTLNAFIFDCEMVYKPDIYDKVSFELIISLP